jgi:hypothetical protein
MSKVTFLTSADRHVFLHVDLLINTSTQANEPRQFTDECIFVWGIFSPIVLGSNPQNTPPFLRISNQNQFQDKKFVHVSTATLFIGMRPKNIEVWLNLWMPSPQRLEVRRTWVRLSLEGVKVHLVEAKSRMSRSVAHLGKAESRRSWGVWVYPIVATKSEQVLNLANLGQWIPTFWRIGTWVNSRYVGIRV